ncbi:MAG TPA: transglutaminase-like domain-containing protein [Myxococcaceae bacterium]|nr:transglutaminase-like domain-containing protein [Myxococcaceae bacterium]
MTSLVAAPLALVLALAPAGFDARAGAPSARPKAATREARPAELSDALKAPRPKAGEWFGLYLLGKKVGHLHSHLERLPESPDKARAVNELYFRAEVGNRVSERRHREVRVYESRPNGKLLSLTVEQSGDGGDQITEATSTEKGLRVIRRRPGLPDDQRDLPPSRETIEAADQARVALLRNAPQEHFVTDGTDLQTYRITSKVEKAEKRPVAGVPVKLRRVTTLSEKEKVPATGLFTPEGETVEIDMGGTMRVVAEPEATAKRLDKVEVFGLTRVVLPRALGEAQQRVPGELKLVVSGLPERFHGRSARQSYRVMTDGSTEITIRAAPPAAERRGKRPLADPAGGEYLKPTLAVESDAPQIRALAKELVGAEPDAWQAAKRIASWVHGNLERDYGASADRATDVLRQKKGDCTEHSLLAVALMRAAGIPARRVDGLVYLMNEDGVPALYWHEWVEAFVGEWTQLDPTFNQMVADPTHLALGEEGGAEITPLIGTLKVVAVK